MSSDSPQPSLRVLVVDDNVDTATTLSELLRRLGCKTAVAFCGEDGLRLASLFQPHLSFIDLNLPDLDGAQVARKMRADDPRPQTLICFTGAVNGPDDGQAAAFDIVTAKPMERSRLVDLVDACRSRLPPDVIAPGWWRIGSPGAG